LEKGANPYLKDKTGRDALEIAKHKGNTKTVKILEDFYSKKVEKVQETKKNVEKVQETKLKENQELKEVKENQELKDLKATPVLVM
jgi:ankyrin repeat protein